VTFTPTPDTAEAKIAELEAGGFRRIEHGPRHPELRAGARVRNYGERWHEAIVHGTAVVVAVLRKGDDDQPDSWERTYGRPNVEVVIDRDPEHRDFGRFSVWSDYGSPLALEQTAVVPLHPDTPTEESL
jgi:hypothetical protein